jgi:hypothetical protein
MLSRCTRYPTDDPVHTDVIRCLSFVIIFDDFNSDHNTSRNRAYKFPSEQTILTERKPFVGEVSANFCGYRVLPGHHNGSPMAVIFVF